MFSKHYFALAIVAACTPVAAFSQPIFTWGPSSQYGGPGSAPAIASPTEVVGNDYPVPVIEIHQGSTTNTLWYQAAVATNPSLPFTLGPPTEFDTNGNAPAVAVNNSGTVIEVHEGGSNIGTLWYRVGAISDAAVITWGAPQQYDVGYNPSISISGNMVMEVHNASNNRSPLLYKMGTVSGGTLTWTASTQYDALGWRPSVSISGCQNTSSCSGLEVHNGLYSAGPLWSHAISINSPTNASFSAAVNYDTGYNPRVQIAFSFGVEVHDGTDSPGPLWYHELSETQPQTWSFGTPMEYDTSDWNPAIAYETTRPIEVHTATGNTGPLSIRSATN